MERGHGVALADGDLAVLVSPLGTGGALLGVEEVEGAGFAMELEGEVVEAELVYRKGLASLELKTALLEEDA